jgi:hypothetical protein
LSSSELPILHDEADKEVNDGVISLLVVEVGRERLLRQRELVLGASTESPGESWRRLVGCHESLRLLRRRYPPRMVEALLLGCRQTPIALARRCPAPVE